MPIFDQGYQHWTGKLSGHAWRWLAIARHGVRTGMKNRWIRIVLLLSWLPAVVLAVVLCLWGLLERKSTLVTPFAQLLFFLDPPVVADPKHYRVEIWTLCYNFFLLIELWFSMILILLVGPNLISQDLRFNALPLYFSRPLRRIDYFLGKLGVIAAFLGMVIIVPSLIAYVLGLMFSLDITIVRDTFPLLLSSIAYGLLIALSAGLLILALSSLSRNSRYVALFWLAIWFVSSVVGSILQNVAHEQRLHAYYRKTMVMAPVQPPNRMSRGGNERFRRQSVSPEAQLKAQKLMAEFQAEQIQAAKTDWRPLVSYTANLSRVGRQLLGTDTAWETLGRLQPAYMRDRYLLQNMGPQYPWYWSAAVLAGLLGLSICILNFHARSLDRLR